MFWYLHPFKTCKLVPISLNHVLLGAKEVPHSVYPKKRLALEFEPHCQSVRGSTGTGEVTVRQILVRGDHRPSRSPDERGRSPSATATASPAASPNRTSRASDTSCVLVHPFGPVSSSAELHVSVHTLQSRLNLPQLSAVLKALRPSLL